MNVYILEDQIFYQKRLEYSLKLAARKLGLALKLAVVTGKPTELLANISTYGSDQLYLLDIRLKEGVKRGLEVAQSIRQRDRLASIVFVTTYSEFASITYHYKVAALGFIDKNQKEEDFCQDLTGYLQHIQSLQADEPQKDMFEVQQKSRYIRLPFQDISYIETSPLPHKLVLHTSQKRIEFYESMKEVERREKRLFRAHKAFLVNPERITELNKTEHILTFSKDQTCLISRRKIKALENLLQTQAMLVDIRR